jgi:hypothetical protein
MRLRFVTCNDPVSGLIRDREGDIAKWVGFTPSHVEIAAFASGPVLVSYGKPGYLGAHYDGGVAIRPVGYDTAKLLHELFVDVPLPDEAAAEAWARKKIGATYDWRAILDFLIPEDWHARGELICSAFCTGALENGNAWSHPLALPWHMVSPALLLFWLSGRIVIATTTAEQVK